MAIEIFDTHTHLNIEHFLGREKEELVLARKFGVVCYNVVGFDNQTIQKALELAEKFPNVYATIGWHPVEAQTYDKKIEEWLLSRLIHPKVIALGEIGLDYHWMTTSKEIQREVFQRQVELAKKTQLPFVIHTRDALEDTYQIVEGVGLGDRGGVIHSYSGSWEMAKRFIKLGLMISLSGVVTFRKAFDLHEVARKIPLEKLLVETDAPYLAPVPKRGQENKTAYARYVVEKIAELRDISSQDVASITYENAVRFFNLGG